ncbi:unnamed protein product, partial [Aphanomyces euteiches]
MVKALRALGVFTATLLPATVFGHGCLTAPKPTYINPYGDPTAFCGTVNGPKLYPNEPEGFNRGPEDNVNAFLPHLHRDYTSLKDFADKTDSACGECGITKFDAATPLPSDGIIKWRNGQEGWVSSHEGPCEFWCDSTLVYYDDNCARNNPSGDTKIDLGKCQGAKKFVVIWLAMHAPDWQIYKNCVALADGVDPSPTGQPNLTSSPTYIDTTSPPSPNSSDYTNAPNVTSSPDPYAPTATPSPKPTRKVQTVAPISSAPTTNPTTNTPTSSATTARPTSSAPTARPTTSTARPTTTAGKVAGGWQQCGGKGFTSPSQCVRGYHCERVVEWYFQCIPNAIGVGEIETYSQCGGHRFESTAKCKDGDECTKLDDWYSQCLPIKR